MGLHEKVITNGRLILIALSIKYDGKWDEIYKDIVEHIELEDKYVEQAKTIAHTCVTLLDENYPRELRDSAKPPFVIFGTHTHR